jgi:hypothetical protein
MIISSPAQLLTQRGLDDSRRQLRIELHQINHIDTITPRINHDIAESYLIYLLAGFLADADTEFRAP